MTILISVSNTCFSGSSVSAGDSNCALDSATKCCLHLLADNPSVCAAIWPVYEGILFRGNAG